MRIIFIRSKNKKQKNGEKKFKCLHQARNFVLIDCLQSMLTLCQRFILQYLLVQIDRKLYRNISDPKKSAPLCV